MLNILYKSFHLINNSMLINFYLDEIEVINIKISDYIRFIILFYFI